MKFDPAAQEKTATFAEAMSMEPLGAAAEGIGQFKLGLFNGATRWGWLGQDSSGFCTLVKSAEEAVSLEEYYYGGKMYYRIIGGKYLSCSAAAWAGFYSWVSATAVKLVGQQLVSEHNNQPMSVYESGPGARVYFWRADGYTVLNAKHDPLTI